MQTNTTYSLPHQRAVINHLVASCPKQHGLLVAHQMGGGKTLTALMFLHNFPRSKHMILCPAFLKDLYDRESRRLLGKPLRASTHVLAYSELAHQWRADPAFLDNVVIVMDEAHYLVDLLNGMDAREFQQFYSVLLTKPKKCLALTGTPIQTSVKDLRILINLSAGKEILPLNETEFLKMFTRPRYFNTLFWGYFASGLAHRWTSLALGLSMFGASIVINNKFSVMGGLGRFSLELFENMVDRSNGAVSTSIPSLERFMSSFLSALPGQPPPSVPKNERKRFFTFKRDSDGVDVVYSKERKRENLAKATSMWAAFLQDPTTPRIYRSMGTKEGQTFLVGAMAALSFLVLHTIIKLLHLVHVKLSSEHDPMFYRALDYDALKVALSPYLSHYKLNPGSNGIPVSKERPVYVTYNVHQTKIWTRMVHNYLTDADLKDLGFSTSTLDYTNGLLGTSKLEVTPQSYEKWGRMISNVSPPDTFPPKFETCWELMCAPWDDRVPRGAVVYSEFEKGTQDVLAFLRRKAASTGRPCRCELFSASLSATKMVKVMEDFANQKINVLVLAAGLYEGFSFRRTSQMHILDPPENFKNLAQLMGRVVRMHSHDGLPPKQQMVEYFHYVATFSPSFGTFLTNTLQGPGGLVQNRFGYWSELLKLWKCSQTYKQTLPSNFKPTIFQTLTPEALTYLRLQPLADLVRKIETTISTKVILPAMQCCPSYELEGPSPDCMATHLSPCNAN